ncbi:MAG TPA: hypothetical protein CFH78_02885 [Sulfurimonas sp. UBA10385]|nr:MAG TPA: hypothetical protein CFH78_02885 [Sulfurimonas sp. UBA10385]
MYIVTALKPEAQAFVDKYKLKKSKCDNFTLFSDEKLKVIIGGIGVHNAKNATLALIQMFKPSNNDIFINVGICGANQKYTIGELIKIGSIVYKDKKYIINDSTFTTITCKDIEMSYDVYDIVDMESFGFYEATKEIKNRYMYKVVSDNFEPNKVTKEGTKKLIFSLIDEIMKEVEI